MHKLLNPTKQQQLVCDWWDTETSHGMLQAVAGSGKSTTIQHLIAHILETKSETKYLCTAFNVHNARDLENRGLNAKTLNSLGHSFLKFHSFKLHLDTKKYERILTDYLPDTYYETCQLYLKAFHLLRNTLIPLSDLQRIEDCLSFYNIPIPSSFIEELSSIFAYLHSEGIRLFLEKKIIDFSDQIILPLVFKDKIRSQTYDLVALDEAQDLSPAQIELCLLLKKPDTRFLIAFDEFQSIQGFTGAHTKTTSLLLESLKPHRMSLTTSFRCPKAIVPLAKSHVKEFDVCESAIEGTILEWDINDVVKNISKLEKYPMIICRLNAPIISLCLQLIGQKLPARVKGRDIKESLLAVLNSIKSTTKKLTRKSFLSSLRKLRDSEIERCKSSSLRRESIADKYSSLIAIFDSCTSKNFMQEMLYYIHDIFDENLTNVIELSSIHKAKGLEKDIVIFYLPSLCPSKYARTDEEIQQEKNLVYVAVTRTKDALIFVD